MMHSSLLIRAVSVQLILRRDLRSALCIQDQERRMQSSLRVFSFLIV